MASHRKDALLPVAAWVAVVLLAAFFASGERAALSKLSQRPPAAVALR